MAKRFESTNRKWADRGPAAGQEVRSRADGQGHPPVPQCRAVRTSNRHPVAAPASGVRPLRDAGSRRRESGSTAGLKPASGSGSTANCSKRTSTWPRNWPNSISIPRASKPIRWRRPGGGSQASQKRSGQAAMSRSQSRRTEHKSSRRLREVRQAAGPEADRGSGPRWNSRRGVASGLPAWTGRSGRR